MQAAPPVTPPEAQEVLCHWAGTDISGVELAGEGTWSRCYGFEHQGRELVARFGHHVEDFRRDRHATGWQSVLPSMLAAFDAMRSADLSTVEGFGPWDAERSLIHDDLLYRNVMVRDDQISGVFDWGCRPASTTDRMSAPARPGRARLLGIGQLLES